MGVLNIKSAIPMGTKLITTANKYSEEDASIGFAINSSIVGVIKDIQTVVAVSKYAVDRGINIGDNVLLNLNRYAIVSQKKNNSLKDSMDEHYDNMVSFNIPIIKYNNEDHLDIDANDVTHIVTEFDYVDSEKL